jgi:hypothetical protein
VVGVIFILNRVSPGQNHLIRQRGTLHRLPFGPAGTTNTTVCGAREVGPFEEESSFHRRIEGNDKQIETQDQALLSR